MIRKSVSRITDRLNNIFFRVFGTFAILILVFAIVLGVIFVRLNLNATKEYNEFSLNRMAQHIAARFKNFLIDGDYEESMEYLAMFGELETTELWALSNPEAKAPMPAEYVNVPDNTYEEQEEFNEIVRSAF